MTTSIKKVAGANSITPLETHDSTIAGYSVDDGVTPRRIQRLTHYERVQLCRRYKEEDKVFHKGMFKFMEDNLLKTTIIIISLIVVGGLVAGIDIPPLASFFDGLSVAVVSSSAILSLMMFYVFFRSKILKF